MIGENTHSGKRVVAVSRHIEFRRVPLGEEEALQHFKARDQTVIRSARRPPDAHNRQTHRPTDRPTD
jgi:hypothetical protein